MGQVEGARRQGAAAGESEGIAFAFDRIERTPNTIDAHRLIALAGERGVQDAVVESFFRGYFSQGRDLGDRGTLLDLAERAGLDRGAPGPSWMAARTWTRSGMRRRGAPGRRCGSLHDRTGGCVDVLNPAPRVVVVGGSLGVLFHAIALRSLGSPVEVFEKSSGLMEDRGAATCRADFHLLRPSRHVAPPHGRPAR